MNSNQHIHILGVYYW